METAVMDNTERRLIVELNRGLIKDAKVQAAKEGITLKQLVILALSQYIVKNKKRGD